MFGKFVPELIETGHRVFTYAQLSAESRAFRPWLIGVISIAMWTLAGLCVGSISVISRVTNPPAFQPLPWDVLGILALGITILNALLVLFLSMWATNDVDVERRQHRRNIWILGNRVWTSTIDVQDGDSIILFHTEDGHGGSVHSGYVLQGKRYRPLASFMTSSHHPDANLLGLYDRVGQLLGIPNVGYGNQRQLLGAMFSWFRFW